MVDGGAGVRRRGLVPELAVVRAQAIAAARQARLDRGDRGSLEAGDLLDRVAFELEQDDGLALDGGQRSERARGPIGPGALVGLVLAVVARAVGDGSRSRAPRPRPGGATGCGGSGSGGPR
jgi:hypothetical protein